MKRHPIPAGRRLTPARSGALLLLRWMFFLVVAFDLASSPLHAHHHVGGPEGYGHGPGAVEIAGLHASDPLEIAHDALSHADVDDSAQIGHSLSALRFSSAQAVAPDTSESGADVPMPPLWLVVLAAIEPIEEPKLALRPVRERSHIPSFRTVPPDGRAPPLTHV